MEVIEAYKKTDIGIFPESWELLPFTEIASLKHGFQFMEHHFSRSGIGVIKIGNLIRGSGIDLKNLSCVEKQQLSRYKKFLLKKGDVLMALTGATLGKVSVVNTDEILLQNYRVGNFIPNSKTSREYLYHITQSFLIQNTVKYLVNEAAQPNLGKADFDKILIPLPPLPEQKAIAEVLTDTDNLIQSLEKQILKKRLIKKGAMQKLLNPKDGWIKRRLGEIADFFNGKAHEPFINENGIYKVINSKFISTDGDIIKHSSINLCPLKEGDITMVMSDIPNGKALAKCFVVPRNDIYALNQRICGIRTNSMDNNFLAAFLNRNQYFLDFDSGTGQTNLRKSEVLDCPVIFPPKISEQQQISNMLVQMENEVIILQKELQKYNYIKQGLMQNLLTGRIRLT